MEFVILERSSSFFLSLEILILSDRGTPPFDSSISSHRRDPRQSDFVAFQLQIKRLDRSDGGCESPIHCCDSKGTGEGMNF